MNNRLTGAGVALLASVVTTFGCSSSADDKYETIGQSDTDGASAGSGSGTATGAGGASSGSGSSAGSAINNNAVSGITTGFVPDKPDDMPEDETCAAADTPTMLQKVVLAFVFDVSASMGNGQFPYFSRPLKWDPVVAATKAFFEDPNSKGLSASLTFFPNENAAIATGQTAMGMGLECVAEDYMTPDVPITELPSAAFSAAIDAVTPPDDMTWRLGTPTLPAVDGTIQAIQALQAADPNTRYVMVLVTDGMPALCTAVQIPDSVQPVVQAVSAVAATIPTYVIGVNNPVTEEEPNPPDTVSDLNLVAEAGGTDAAFIVDTTDPAVTTAQFKTIVDTIREFSFSCSLAIPEPAGGEVFDKDKVNVKYTSPSLGEIPFDYDPSCTAATNGWHYDNEENPTAIQICGNVCDAIRVQMDEGNLSVELGCKTREPA